MLGLPSEERQCLKSLHLIRTEGPEWAHEGGLPMERQCLKSLHLIRTEGPEWAS